MRCGKRPTSRGVKVSETLGGTLRLSKPTSLKLKSNAEHTRLPSVGTGHAFTADAMTETDHLKIQIARCRRLARLSDDARTSKSLLALAAEYEERLRQKPQLKRA